MAAFVGPNVFSNSLIGFWDAANSTSYPGSGSTWYDLTENGNHATLGGAVAYSSDDLGKMSFGNAGDVVTFPDVSLFDFGANNFTVGGWFYLAGSWDTTNGGRRGHFLTKWNTGAQDGTNEWFLGVAGGQTQRYPTFTIEGGTTSYQIQTASNISVPAWYHFVGVRETNTTKLYINGELEGSRDVTGVTVNTVAARQMKLGVIDGTSNAGFYRDIPLVYVFNRDLSGGEVKQLFNAHRGRYGI